MIVRSPGSWLFQAHLFSLDVLPPTFRAKKNRAPDHWLTVAPRTSYGEATQLGRREVKNKIKQNKTKKTQQETATVEINK